VFPGGTGQTEQQVQAMAELKPDGYVGTPSFLKIILEKADATGVGLTSLKKALVSGEAFPPSLRNALNERGIAGYQAYATADVGTIAYETEAREGLVIDEGCSSRSCVPVPAIPSPQARSARSWSRPCSTPTTR